MSIWEALRTVWAARLQPFGAVIAMAGVLLAAAPLVAGAFRRQPPNTLTLQPYQSAAVGPFVVTHLGVSGVPGAASTQLQVESGGQVLGILRPQVPDGTTAARPATYGGPWYDLQAAVLIAEEGGAATYRVTVVDMAGWVWWGQALLLFGGVLLLWPARTPVLGAGPRTTASPPSLAVTGGER